MKRTLVLLMALSFLFYPLAFAGRKAGTMPAPELISPSDATDLTGKKELEFRWGMGTGGAFDQYDFRLYKGTQTYENGLMLKKELPRDIHSLLLDAAQFEPGQNYVWSLRYIGANKSRAASSIFFVKK